MKQASILHPSNLPVFDFVGEMACLFLISCANLFIYLFFLCDLCFYLFIISFYIYFFMELLVVGNCKGRGSRNGEQIHWYHAWHSIS